MQSWLSAIALGVVCTGAALAIYFYLIGAIGATRSISVAYLIPLFGVLWGCVFLMSRLRGRSFRRRDDSYGLVLHFAKPRQDQITLETNFASKEHVLLT